MARAVNRSAPAASIRHEATERVSTVAGAAVGNAMWLLVAAAAIGIVTSWLLLVREPRR